MKTAYEVCSSCRGHGLTDAMDGPVTCYECKGNCYVRARDEKGRFTTIDKPSIHHFVTLIDPNEIVYLGCLYCLEPESVCKNFECTR